MFDFGLFVFGLLGGVLALFVGGPVLLAAPIVLAIVSGIRDGRISPRLRWVRSWAPGLLGSLVVPVGGIVKDQFRDPPAPDGGLALSVGLALLAGFAAAFVLTTLVVSAVTRFVRPSAAA